MTDYETTARDRARAQDVIWRVTAAVETLCIGKGDVRSRLESAVVYQLHPLRERDFPVALRDRFRRIMDASTRYDASDLDKWNSSPIGEPIGGIPHAIPRKHSGNNAADSARHRRENRSGYLDALSRVA